MNQFLRVLLSFVVFLAFGYAKSDMTFGENVSLGENSLTFDVENLDITENQMGQITHKKLILCDNNLSGFIEYTKPDTLTYYPTKPLKVGVKYSCKINPKYSNKDSFITFYTHDFGVKSLDFDYPNTVRVAFNGMVSDDEILKNVKFQKIDKLAKSKVSYKIQKSNGKIFVLKLDEDVKKFRCDILKSLSSKNGAKIGKDLDFIRDSKALKYKTYKNTREFVFYDEPTSGVWKKGKISLLVFTKESFYGDDNIRKFIKIKGVKNFSVTDSNWVSEKMQKKYSLDNKSWSFFRVVGDFKPHTSYEITFLKGFGNSQYQLADSKTFRVKTGDFGSYVGFEDSKKPYISSYGDIGIKSVNVDKITIIIDKMLKQNLRYFINFNNKMKVKSISSEVVNKTFIIGGKKNVYTKHKIPLKEALNGLSSGIYDISIHYGKDKHISKKVYLSDIGLGAKVYKDGIFVWTSSLKDTNPIKNAKVQIFSSSNMLIASGKTNKYGVFEYNKKDFLKANPRSILVTKKDEQNFLVLDKAVGESNLKNKNKNAYSAYIYFQSELIRPDESLKALIVLKNEQFKSLKNAPISVKVENRMGKVIYKKSLKTDEKGAIRLDISMLGQKTGRYILKVNYADKVRARKGFSVEAFLPQKIKNSITLPKGFVKTDSFIEANASSHYLFGSPSSFLKGVFRLRAVEKDFKSKKYKNFSFTNELLKSKNSISFIDKTKNFTLDKNGTASVLLPTNIDQTPASIMEGQIELSVFSDGRRVSTYKNIDIYPYKKMVGLKIKNKIIDTNTPINIKTLLINPFTDKNESGMLDIYIKKVNWHYSYDEANRFYKWSKEVEDEEHLSVKAGEDISKLFSKSGDYVVVAKDSFGLHSSSVGFSVRGWDYSSISPTDEMGKNQVNFEEKPYKKGDRVKLDIKSPIKEGKMLVTLEGKRVYWYKLLSFENGHVKVDVPLDVELKGGVYIHTIATRATNSSSNIVPFRASSSSFIKPDRTKFKLNPVIKSKDMVKSNSIVPIKIKAKANSLVLVSVVDDGILQILGQKPPKPFEFFDKKAKDLVTNFDIYDMLMNHLTKGKKLNFGSGAIRNMAFSKKHLSPKTGAKRVKPFVYFSKLLHADKNGEIGVELKVPSSFNGSATIVAVEIGDEAIGASSKKLTIKDKIIIEPVFPRYGSVGDSWVVPVRVFNTTDESLEVDLHATVSDALHVSGFNQKLELKPNSSKLLHANYEVKSFGKGKASLSAKTKDEIFTYEVELPLIFAYPLDTYNVQGETKTPLSLQAPKEYMSGVLAPKYTLSVSGDVLARLRGGLDYLISYPYGCAEQTSSKLLALSNMKPFLDTKNKDELKANLHDREKFINLAISKLASMQKQNGDFGYWRESGYVNIYASIYASDVLLSLKKDKFFIQDGVIKGVIKSLKNFSRLKDKQNYFSKVYATYLLSTQNIIDISNVNYIYDNKIYQNSLPSIYMMAYILKKARMQSEEKAVLKLARDYDFSLLKSKKREFGRYFYSYPRDIAFSLYLHVKHFSKDKMSDKLYTKLKKEFKNLYSTQDKAFALRAINEYFKGYKKGKNSFIITGEGIDEIYEYEANLKGVYKQNSIKLTPKDSWINYNFSVMQYLPKPIKHENSDKKTLNIHRYFIDKDGKNVDLENLKVGDVIYSSVVLTPKEDIKNVVINEQIPSCFEVINERVTNSYRPNKVKNGKNYKPDFVDIRDDRVLTFLNLKADIGAVYFTPLSVTTKGECLLPPILSEAMYDERINDYDLEVKSVKVK